MGIVGGGLKKIKMTTKLYLPEKTLIHVNGFLEGVLQEEYHHPGAILYQDIWIFNRKRLPSTLLLKVGTRLDFQHSNGSIETIIHFIIIGVTSLIIKANLEGYTKIHL